MISRIFLTSVVLGSFLLTGCATQVTEAGYFWGNYSTTLYDYTKSPSEETLEAHVTELREIIEASDERELKVPPGIHAELGFMLSKQGKDELAPQHFAQEIELYPESRIFIERLTSEE